MGGDARRNCRLPSLAEQIRRASWMAESEELSTQRRQLQEDLTLMKDLMAQQQQDQVQSLEDLWQLQVSMERATLKAGAAEQEQQRLAQTLRGEMTLCREGQQDLARQLLAKMAELNEKLGANMAQLEDEVTRRENEMLQRQEQAEDVRRSHSEALQQECREALYEGRLAGQKAEACEEALAAKTKSVAAEVQRHFSAVVETRAAVTTMRRELQGQQQQVCSGCQGLQNDLKQLGAWSTWLTEILGLPGGPQHAGTEQYEAPWTRQLAQQQEELKKHDAELQSQRTLLENLLMQMQEVKTSEQQRQASTEAMEAMATKQSSSLHTLRQKLAKERKDEAARRASWEEEFSKLRGQIEQDLLDLRKAQAESSVVQAAALEEKQQVLLRHCRAWASDAREVAKDALDERMQQVHEDLRSSGEALARETKQQCRGWVDAALGKLESLAIRSREQLATLSAELPLTVKRLVGEEMAKLRRVPTATQPQLRKVSKHGMAAPQSNPETQPFELGEPLPPPSAGSTRPPDENQGDGKAATVPLHATADAVISGTSQAHEDSC